MIRFGNFADLGISKEIPKKELDNIFLLLEKSYEEMLKNHPKNELIQNNEDRNRNLLKKYMNENLGNFGLSYLVIVAECNVEDKNHNSIGYSDLKIFNFCLENLL